jgi:hypothetical protein
MIGQFCAKETSAGDSQAKWLKFSGFGGIGVGVILVIVGAIEMVAG